MHHACCSKAYIKPSGYYVFYYPFPVTAPYGCAPLYCTYCWKPVDQCICKEADTMKVIQEIMVDPASTPKETFIGGIDEVYFTLEYMPTEIDPTTSTKITLIGPGGTTVWEATDIPEGYHIKDDLTSVAPGTTVKLEVVKCNARLRWCESIKCC